MLSRAFTETQVARAVVTEIHKQIFTELNCRMSLRIDDIHILRAILFKIELSDKVKITEYIFPSFPFKAMIDNPPETVGFLLDILQYFMGYTKFLENANSALSYTIEFILTNVSYFLKKGDSKILFKLIHFLKDLFSRTKFILSSTNLEVDVGRICGLIIPLMETIELRKHLILLFSELLSIEEVIVTESDTAVDVCISKFFSCTEPDSMELSILAVAALRALPELTLNRSSHLYYWIYEECPNFLDKASNKVKANVLDCIISAFKTKKAKDFKLTTVYGEKITSFYRLLRNESFIPNIMKIFCYIINDFVSMGVLPAMESEFVDKMEMVTKTKTKCIFDNEILLVINYLQCLQFPHEIVEEEVTMAIRKMCLGTSNFPPILLKSLCLLYPVFFGKQPRTENVLVENNILDAVERYTHLSQIITYHLQQLQWFLMSNRPNLKITTLEICLTNYQNDEIIIDALKYTDTTELLVQCLEAKTNNVIPRRAAHLLSQLDCPRTSILIRKKLPLSICTESFLSHLFKAKPALPQSKNEGLFFCIMMSRILSKLTEKEAFIGACSYTYRLLVKFKSFSKAAEEFISKEHCVVKLYEAASNSNDEVACCGVVLLIMFLKLQVRHSIKVYGSIPLDFRRLITGSPTRMRKSISLLKLCLHYSMFNAMISLRTDDVLNVYQHLQQLHCAEVYTEIFEIMSKLIKIYSFLAYLSTTILYIEMHCTRIYKTEDQMKHFMLLLADWLQVSEADMDLCGNLMSVSLFLKKQPNNSQTRQLRDLLNKCSG